MAGVKRRLTVSELSFIVLIACFVILCLILKRDPPCPHVARTKQNAAADTGQTEGETDKQIWNMKNETQTHKPFVVNVINSVEETMVIQAPECVNICNFPNKGKISR